MGEVMVRPALEGAGRQTSAFGGFVRTGLGLETKAFTGVSGDTGGYAIPKEIDAQIDALLKAASPIRSVANVVKVGSAPQERLIDLVQSLRAPYRQGATWVMNAATLARIRKFTTSDGAFVWAPSLAAGQPATLLGYPVIEAEDMPDVAANALAIAFGNFRLGYVIAERTETQILRDPYSNKPFVNFYATKRVGGWRATWAAGGVRQGSCSRANGWCARAGTAGWRSASSRSGCGGWMGECPHPSHRFAMGPFPLP